MFVFFFFSSRRRHTRCGRDWSSDVCSSDLNVETWGRKLKALPAYASDAQQKRLDGLIVQAVFKQGEGLAAKGDHGGAATAYLRAAKEFPKDERASKACVNAVVEGRAAADLGLAQTAADL